MAVPLEPWLSDPLSRHPPGPLQPRWGRANYRSWQADMQGFLGELVQAHGDIVGFSLGSQSFVLVHGAKNVWNLFHRRGSFLCKPDFLKESNRGFWGDGLTTLEGMRWQRQRQLLRHVFTNFRIHHKRGAVAECTGDLLCRWSQQIPSSPTKSSAFSIEKELRILTGRIAARVILDADIEAFASSEDRAGLVPLEEVLGIDFTTKQCYDPAAPLFLRRPRAPRQMTATLALIDQRVRSGEDRDDLLSGLLRVSREQGLTISRPELVGEVIQMLYAGHLTIPMALINLWRDLCVHETQETIAAEAERLCGAELPSVEAVRGSLCMAALRESLRLHPPAPLLYREVEESFPMAGYSLPAGWGIWVSPYLLHHDPRYFTKPDHFLPQRFLPRDFYKSRSYLLGSAPQSYCSSALESPANQAYIPFGVGPRICIGQAFALDQIALIALLTLRRFRLRLSLSSSIFDLQSRV